MMFADYALQRTERDQYNHLGQMLGTYWTDEAAEAMMSEGEGFRERMTEVSIPLAFAIRPEMQEMIKKMFGRRYGINAPDWAKTHQVDLFKVSREKFTEIASMFIPLSKQQ